MGSWSSKPKRKKISAQDQAILDLKIQRDRLRQYQKRIAVIVDRENEVARQCLLNNDKRRALLALKKKRLQLSMLEQTDMHLIKIEQLTQAVEFAIVEKQVIQRLKEGNDVLTALNKEMSLENVEKLMADTADAIEYQNEISNALSQQLTPEDEELVEDELRHLQQMEVLSFYIYTAVMLVLGRCNQVIFAVRAS